MASVIKPDINNIKENELDEIIKLSEIVLNFVRVLIITRGSKGVVTTKLMNDTLEPYLKKLDVQVYSTAILNTVENVSGAGDCFASGFIHGILQNLKESQSISIGFETAKQALLSKETVPLKFNSITNSKNIGT
ncbi:jg10835 [Pararge aegeria aegeria]|uniref:Jg10835 protein n=2 Tax=Pararge aegeria TaxID=116150 RepID=A0A8S4SEC5_9NEOP|nr:jg10835 [Pararge aegeria aegeria]